jgi:MFS transporter, SP family, xylose:H+ symportor
MPARFSGLWRFERPLRQEGFVNRSAALFTISSLATGWAYSFHTFILYRIARGVAIGVASNVSPTNVTEISPAPRRGRLVAVNQMGIAVGSAADAGVHWRQELRRI